MPLGMHLAARVQVVDPPSAATVHWSTRILFRHLPYLAENVPAR